MRKQWLAALFVSTLAFSLGGCSTESEVNPSGSIWATSTEDILNRELPLDISAEGVMLAAIIIATGDIEEGVANGLVTPSEADEAQAAITNNTLDLWRQRAEADQS